MLLQLFPQLVAEFFVSWFAKQREHIGLVSFNARLVEWVDTIQVTGNCNRYFKEVDQIAQCVWGLIRNVDAHVRYVAVGVGEGDALKGFGVGEVHRTTFQILQAVQIVALFWNIQVVIWPINFHNGFHQVAQAFLDVLPEGMQIS